jgi:MoxR-like ATPase
MRVYTEGVQSIKDWADAITSAVERVFFGKREATETLLVALLAQGHVLLEDVPGVGKTVLARALASSIDARFSRIQCTPDLLPADITGVSVYSPKDNEFHFREGPILANIVLVDEINRATPRTQSALLEAMAEGQVTVEGRSLSLPDPFFLIATENPVEFDGTFPLPEAQKDRFLLSLRIGYPGREVEKEILESRRRLSNPLDDLEPVASVESVRDMQERVTAIHVEEAVTGYMLDIIEHVRTNRAVRLGGSPRASLALYRCAQARAAIGGRDFVLPDDIKALAPNVLSRRVLVSAEARLRGTEPEDVVEAALDEVRVPLDGGGT